MQKDCTVLPTHVFWRSERKGGVPEHTICPIPRMDQPDVLLIGFRGCLSVHRLRAFEDSEVQGREPLMIGEPCLCPPMRSVPS
jgi:hypothetical protein